MLQFSAGVLCLLLPWFGGLVTGELSDNFTKCLNFFYDETPPQGISGKDYQPICQSYKDKYRFASLYHRQNRTPLYSAYILKTADGGRPRMHWMYEPQLVSLNQSRNMQRCPNKAKKIEKIKESQAVDQDYTNSGYTRGHLTPNNHQETNEDRKATFTLTNIVPQKKESNNGPWKDLESQVLKDFKQYCEGPMYVITGVMPYKSGSHLINNRVSVPEYMWSAYCCPSYKAEADEPLFPTYAAVGGNDPNSTEEILPGVTLKGYDVKRMPLVDLEGILAQRLAMPISLFHGECQQQG